MRTDALGNLICVRHAAKEGGRRIMVSAHMDHIGFVVLDADEHGFLRVHNAGGISKRASLNRHVVFANGVNGVVSNETERFSADDNKMTDLFIDIGAKDREDALSMVALGDVAVYAPDAFEMANGMIAAPAVDDRVGCAIALEAMKELGECENEVAFVFTVQEELGLRGARAAAYGVDPQIGVALDVTLSGDTPKGPKIAVKAGEGPCVKVRDSSLVCAPRVVKGLEEAAERVGVKTQREVLSAGGNDAARHAGRARGRAGGHHLHRLPLRPLRLRDHLPCRLRGREKDAGGVFASSRAYEKVHICGISAARLLSIPRKSGIMGKIGEPDAAGRGKRSPRRLFMRAAIGGYTDGQSRRGGSSAGTAQTLFNARQKLWHEGLPPAPRGDRHADGL